MYEYLLNMICVICMDNLMELSFLKVFMKPLSFSTFFFFKNKYIYWSGGGK